jgi:raffinose/stachyose/melibiose transport system permease protein
MVESREGAGMKRILRQIILLGCLLIAGYPLVWMAMSAVRKDAAIQSNPFALPAEPTMEQVRGVLNSGGFGSAYVNSLIVCLTSVVLAVAASALAAYAFARMRFRGRELLFLLFLAGMMVPIHVTLIPLNRLMSPNALNLKNTYFALIGPYVGFALPISILILRGAFAQVPEELEEAARMDGCGHWGIFFHVALPLVRPALATVVIFNFLTMWNEFAFAMTLVSDRAVRTVPLALWEFQGQYGTYLGKTCAALCVAVLPVLFVYAVAQRHIIRGLTAGALKQ